MCAKLPSAYVGSLVRSGSRSLNDWISHVSEQVDEVGRALYFDKSQRSSELKTISSLNFPLVSVSEGRITSVTSC